MFIGSKRFILGVLVFNLSISPVLFSADAVITNIQPGDQITITNGKKIEVKPLTFSDAMAQVKAHPYLYSSLLLAALMVYRFESKGPCENVDYDFNTLMRSTDGYMAKVKKAIAWFDRYIIGQPYKSKSVKAKDGDLVISDAQEALGVMGIAQSNIKPMLVSLGSAGFLHSIKDGSISKEKLDSIGWSVLFIILGLK